MTKKNRVPIMMVIVLFAVLAVSFSVFGARVIEGEGDYIIKKGDTLWDIAETHLGDPLLWPQIWKLNPYIKDPHWIYPDNRLTLPTPESDLTSQAGVDGEDYLRGGMEIPPDSLLPPPPEPKPLATKSEMYASGFISKRQPDQFFGYVIEAEELNKKGLSENDIVYIDKGADDGILEGDIFFVINKGPAIYHPVNGSFEGTLYNNRGMIQVLCVQEETSTAKIIESYDVVLRGDIIEPFEEYPAPSAIEIEKADFCEPATGSLDGYIIASKDGVKSLAKGHITYLDLGTDDGVAPGDMFVSFKRPGGVKPDVYTGELVVIRAEENTSTALIYRSKFEIAVGDYIRQK